MTEDEGMISHSGDGSGELEVEGIEVVLETTVDDGSDGSKYSRDAIVLVWEVGEGQGPCR